MTLKIPITALREAADHKQELVKEIVDEVLKQVGERFRGVFSSTGGSTITPTALPDISDTYQATSEKGSPSGYAPLDGSSQVPDANIPSAIARDTEVATAVTNHEGNIDPHIGYQKESEKAGASGYASLDSGTKVPQAQLGSGSGGAGTKVLYDDQTYKTPTAGITAHNALTGLTTGDDHTQYQQESEKGVASGYASLDSGVLVPVAQLGTGTPDGTKFLRDDRVFAVPSGGGSPLTVQEIDGSPIDTAVTIIRVTNGKLTDNGAGDVTLDLSGSGGGGTIYTSAYASPPGSPTNGDWWYPSDSVGLYAARISGAWQWFFNGWPVTLPVAVASWTWVNQSTSVATDVGGGIYLITPIGSNAQNYRCLVKTAPSTPYTITAAFLPDIWGGDAALDSVNLICRESGTGKIQGPLWANSGSNVYHQQMTSATVHSSNPSNAGAWYQSQPVWLQLSDNGTNIISRVSSDGRNWDQIYTQSRTAFMAAGPNQVGWAVNGYATVGQGAATLVAWIES